MEPEPREPKASFAPLLYIQAAVATTLGIFRDCRRVDRRINRHADGTSCVREKWQFIWILHSNFEKIRARYVTDLWVGGRHEHRSVIDQMGFTNWGRGSIYNMTIDKNEITIRHVRQEGGFYFATTTVQDGSTIGVQFHGDVCMKLVRDMSRTCLDAETCACGTCLSEC